MYYLLHNSVNIILLLNTNWNGEQVTVAIVTDLPFDRSQQISQEAKTSSLPEKQLKIVCMCKLKITL